MQLHNTLNLHNHFTIQHITFGIERLCDVNMYQYVSNMEPALHVILGDAQMELTARPWGYIRHMLPTCPANLDPEIYKILVRI